MPWLGPTDDMVSKVGNSWFSVGMDQDVGRLQVTVKQPVCVRVVDSLGNLNHQLDRALHGQRAIEQFVPQVAAWNEFEDDETVVLVQLSVIVNGHDVWVRNFGSGLSLPKQTFHEGSWIFATNPRNFDSNIARKALILSPIDCAERSLAENSQHAVPANLVPSHGRRVGAPSHQVCSAPRAPVDLVN